MKNKKVSILLLLVVVLVLSSCGKNSNKEPVKVEQEEKAPESLRKIYENTTSIMKEIEKEIENEELKIEGKVEIKKDLEKSLKKINENIKKTHEQWNKYEVEGLKKGVTKENIDKFEASLNEMTVAIENKEFSNVIVKGSRVFLNIAPFFDLYKDEMCGDISRIKYFVYQGFLYGQKGDIEKATNSLNQIEESISKIKLKLEEDGKKVKDVEKLRQSIEDMKLSLRENSDQLLIIKKNIVIKNLEEFEK